MIFSGIDAQWVKSARKALNVDSSPAREWPGPAPGSRPYAKIIGKIARPANIAIKVSKLATVSEVLNIFSS